MRRIPLAVLPLALVAVLTSSCSWGSSSEPTAGPTKVGGMTACTMADVQPFINDYLALTDTNTQMPIRDLQCAKGWAVAAGIRGPKNAPAGGPQGAPTSIILEAEGQFWIIKDKAKVCGTYDPNQPQALPPDALVPADLYTAGCLAG